MIVIASQNKHKIEEIALLPQAKGLQFAGISSFGNAPDVEENGHTFEENAVIKAVRYSIWLKRECGHEYPVIAEDSGLQVAALSGWPGIYSARVADTSEEANRILLEKMQDLHSRDAQFVAVTALAVNGIYERSWRGSVRGRISEEVRGKEGFGYDPVFEFGDSGKTFAELGQGVKKEHSHRSKAWAQALDWISQNSMLTTKDSGL